MYDAMLESRTWARENRFRLAISEATVVPACLALHPGDVLAGPADGRVLYPVSSPRVRVMPFEVAVLQEVCSLAKRQHRQRVVVAFVKQKEFDTAATASLLNKSASERWPRVLVVPSNRFHEPLADVPEIAVDGHDAVAVYRVVSESIRHGRNDQGPAVIHTHAGLGSTGKDGLSDPLARFERYLTAKGLTAERLHVVHDRDLRS